MTTQDDALNAALLMLERKWSPATVAVLISSARGTITMGDVQRMCNRGPSSACKTVAAIERAGLVKRRRGDVDTRNVLVEPTKAGRKHLTAAFA